MKVFRNFLADLTFGFRIFSRRRTLGLVAVFSLILGIGPNIAVLAAARAALVRPLAFQEPDQLVNVLFTAPGALAGDAGLTLTDLRVLTSSVTLEGLAGQVNRTAVIRGVSEAEYSDVAEVTDNYAEVVRPVVLAGRFLSASDRDQDVAVISEKILGRQFPSIQDPLGQTLIVNGRHYVIVGILSAAADPSRNLETSVWLPLLPTAATRDLVLVGRLHRNQSIADATSRIQTALKSTGSASSFQVSIERVADSQTAGLRSQLVFVEIVSASVLLLCCLNVGNLLVSHLVTRHDEFALRTALGASKGRLARQFLGEVSAVGLLAGIGSIGLAFFLTKLVPLTIVNVLPPTSVLRIGLAEAAASISLGLVAVVGAGLLPVLVLVQSGTRAHVGSVHRATSGRVASRVRFILLTGHITVTTVALVYCAVLARSFVNVATLPLGFDTKDLIVADIALQGLDAQSDRRAVLESLSSSLRSELGATVALGNTMPYGSRQTSAVWTVLDSGQRARAADVRRVSASYFQVLGIRLARGRLFDDKNLATHEVVVNHTFVTRFRLGENAIGSQIVGSDRIPMTIVGIADDIRTIELTRDPNAAVYLPLRDAPANQLSVAVRTSRADFADQFRRILPKVHPDIAIDTIDTVDQRIGLREARRRFYFGLMTILGLVGSALAAIGLFGVASHAMEARKREMGIRLALGAEPAVLRRVFVIQGLWPVLIGLAVGVAGAIVWFPLLTSLEAMRFQIFGVSRFDIPAISAACVLVAAVSTLACLIPAKRITGGDLGSLFRAD